MAQNTKNTKWKYGTIPATERLSMLRKGNKDLYDEELSRTRDAIENRLAAGLDVSEQMKWGDTISYQYNLSQAEKAGENPENGIFEEAFLRSCRVGRRKDFDGRRTDENLVGQLPRFL